MRTSPITASSCENSAISAFQTCALVSMARMSPLCRSASMSVRSVSSTRFAVKNAYAARALCDAACAASPARSGVSAAINIARARSASAGISPRTNGFQSWPGFMP